MATAAQLEAIRNAMEMGWDESTCVTAWNERCDKNGYYDDRISTYEYMLEEMSNMTPHEIIQQCCYGDVRAHGSWAEMDGNGNWHTFSDLYESNNFDWDIMVDFIAEHGDGDAYLIDRDTLVESFADEYCEGDIDLAESVIDSSGCDLLTDDWDDVYENGAESLRELSEEETE